MNPVALEMTNGESRGRPNDNVHHHAASSLAVVSDKPRSAWPQRAVGANRAALRSDQAERRR